MVQNSTRANVKRNTRKMNNFIKMMMVSFNTDYCSIFCWAYPFLSLSLFLSFSQPLTWSGHFGWFSNWLPCLLSLSLTLFLAYLPLLEVGLQGRCSLPQQIAESLDRDTIACQDPVLKTEVHEDDPLNSVQMLWAVTDQTQQKASQRTLGQRLLKSPIWM